MSKVVAYANIGYHLVKTGLRRMMGGTRGMEAFLDNYREDRLPPLASEERALLSAIDGCVACGLCDTVSSEVSRAARAEFAGASVLPLSYSRHPPDYEGLTTYLAHLDRADLGRIESICPARIPFRRLASLVRDVAARTRNPQPPKASRGGAATRETP